MRVDVLVVGSGIAGAGAALAARRAGASVGMVRRGYGATAMASGAVRLDPAAMPPGAAREVEGLLVEVLGLKPLGRRVELLTALGQAVEADLAFPTMTRGVLAALRGRSLAVVGFDGLNEVRPEPVARAAVAAGVDAAPVRLPFPEAKHGHDLTTPELARLCDDLTPAQKLSTSLKAAAADFDMIALPPMLGLTAWPAVRALFDEALGERWFELVAALPSVPGMRLQQSIDDTLAEAKIAIVHGPIHSWAGQGDRVTAVEAGQAEGRRRIELKEAVLATGGVIGRGLRVTGGGVREALLGLAVSVRSTDDEELAPELRSGLTIDDELRPLDEQGAPAFANLRAAGELTGLTYGSGRGGLGVALATGWAAGELSARAAEAGAFGELEQWHTVEVDQEPLGCLNCGLCLSRCPTVRALAREKQAYPGPRGMMSGLTRFETEVDEIADELSLCTLCGACSAVCPAGVPVPENITRARQVMARVAPEAGPKAYQALRGALDEPKKLFDAEPILGPHRDQAECVLFIGCSLPYYEREHAQGTIKLLEALGVDFTLIDEVCCGGPLEVIGATGADAMARHNVAEMSRVGAKRIITCCPRCAETMATTAAYGDFEVEHTTMVMARMLPGSAVAARLRERLGGGAVTFHDPCERARLAGEVEAAREVMASVGLELVEMPRAGINTECCGAGGGVRAAQTKTSIRMARMRVADAVATGAPRVLTECPSCLHNLYNGRRRKQNIEISNLSSYLGAELD